MLCIVPTVSPVISKTETISLGRVVVHGTQGQEMMLECISRGGSPIQTIKWYRESVTGTPLTSVSTNVIVDEKYDVTTRYTFTPTRTDDRQGYICQSSYPTEPKLVDSTGAELYLQCKFVLQLIHL